MRTGPTNEQLKTVIQELEKKAVENGEAIWSRLATDLSKPSRQRREVNLSRINRFTEKGETVVVPGKVLSSGELGHPVTIFAWSFSEQAKEKIKKSNSSAHSLGELMKKDIKGKGVRILG
jgi:large subunit ribosomal protein L18e